MANSYTKIYIQYVFAVKYRENCITPHHNEPLQKYISGIIKNRKSQMIAINNMPDHIHILVRQHPTYPVSKMAQEIKNNASKMINEAGWFSHKFSWQTGYGAFSYGHAQIPKLKQYIHDQQKHHATHTFQEEYLKLLQIFDIDFDEHYVFDFLDKTTS